MEESEERMTYETQLTKIPQSFVITYYADKHNKIITRHGQWLKPDTDTTGKVFVSDKGKVCFIYWDLDAEPNKNGSQWRMATNPMSIRAI